ncbi:hypothetical protein [Arcobacter vandammei]|uniref:hypothetical protein n=1 Tax=Arcobacter vandammei TaxID=2782243 RepID=UPI0018DF41C2|nr:hypothetical protein [Arcobacter vandammei]
MREITQVFAKKNIIFKEFKEVLPKEINSRKNIKIYVATGVDMKFYAIFVLEQKSRFLRKNANELMELCEQLASFMGHNFKVKELFFSGDMCSKAKAYLKDNFWGVKENKSDFM